MVCRMYIYSHTYTHILLYLPVTPSTIIFDFSTCRYITSPFNKLLLLNLLCIICRFVDRIHCLKPLFWQSPYHTGPKLIDVNLFKMFFPYLRLFLYQVKSTSVLSLISFTSLSSCKCKFYSLIPFYVPSFRKLVIYSNLESKLYF